LRVALVAVGVLAAVAASAQTQTVTIPAAASIVGISPFFSDVRVFNTSYTGATTVTATYYCFLGDCPGAPPQITIDIASRDSEAFNDIVAGAFASPGSAGGIEFTYDGTPGQVIITSRLYSTAPNPTVGMFIPGLDGSQAHTLSALTSVMSGDVQGNGGNNGAGFRTNVGIYNPNDSPATITFTAFANHAPVGGDITRVIGPHSGGQINGIFDESTGNFPSNTDNGVVFVSSDVPVFSYAAVIDNNTSDPYLVIGSPDQTNGAFTPTPTQTSRFSPTATQTRTPIHRTFTPTPNNSASPTPTPPASSSPLIRPPARRASLPDPRQGPGAQVASTSFYASLVDERYLAILRGPTPKQGGW
jgi:hypothetical protein